MMRPGQWEPLIDEASQRFGVPQDIIMRVMGVESGGRRDAVSPKGAAGLMQLMAPTYTELARKHNLGPDRFDPRNNVMAGTAYLRENYDRFGGDWSKALVAYNAGPSRAESDRPLPAETQAYVPKVLAGFEQGKGTDVAPGLIRPQPGQTSGMGAMFGAVRPNQSLTGLLEVEDANNFYDGLGNLLNFGQTPSQPPRTDPAAMPGTTQTDRMDVSGRINELLADYMKQPQQRSSVSPLQYALGGMSGAVQPLAGVHDRQVGIGEMLGALGGGLTRGNLAGDEAQRQQRANQIGELGTLGKIQQYQRGEATADRQLAAAAAFADRLDQAGQKDLAAAVRGNPSLMDEVVKAMAASQYPKDGTGNFSLSPGQTQFDRFGKPIASVTDRPQTTTLSPGQSLVEQGTGKPITTAGPGTVQLTPAEVAAAGLPVGTVAQRKADGSIDVVSKPDGTQFDQTTKLRGEFTTAAKPLIEMRQMYGRIEAAYKDTTPVGDIAMTYSFMKMLDPTSVVREGEYATAQNAAGVPDRIRQQWNALIDGNRLTPGVRDDMYKQAQAQFGVIEKQHGELEGRYRDLATRQGLKADDVVIDLRGGVKADGGAKAPDPANPKVGDRVKNSQTGAMVEWNGSAWVPVQ